MQFSHRHFLMRHQMPEFAAVPRLHIHFINMLKAKDRGEEEETLSPAAKLGT